MRFCLLWSFLILLTIPSAGQVPIGEWREHLPYGQATGITESLDKIWCSTPYSIFSIDKSENSIDRWSKVNGLTETGIACMATRKDRSAVIIAYNNNNIDVLKNGIVKNINAIKNSTQTGNKRIFSINYQDHGAYLSTGIGIILIDPEKLEVKDTYIIGDGGSKIVVFETLLSGNNIYAATEQGLKHATINSGNLADYRSWENLSGSNGLPPGPVVALGSINNQLLVSKSDTLYLLNGNSWQVYYSRGSTIKSFNNAGTKLIVAETKNANGNIVILNAFGIIDQIIQQAQYIQAPLAAIAVEGDYWIADSIRGLSKYSGNNFQSYNPNSPLTISDGKMVIQNDQFWVSAGSVDNTWRPTNNKSGLFYFNNNEWINFNSRVIPAMDSLPDIITAAIDPESGLAWFGSYGGGMFTLEPNKNISIFKQNSPILPAYFSPGAYRVSGLVFDKEGNLWISNYGGNKNLHVRKKDGSWQSFLIPFPLAENAVGEIIIDEFDQKWIIAPNGQGLICFNHGNSIDNSNDDRWKWFRSGKGNGNLPNTEVLSIVKDKNSFIWIGTKQGIGIIQCPQEVFNTQGCEAILPVVQQDNFAGYLFRDEEVQALCIDGADRKWVGTKNGVWLISADAEKTIYRFNSSNSPLPDDDIKQITINGKTGEVYFSTAKGIVSFRSTATEASIEKNEVLVFPNPVPPGYTGTIGIRGLPNNSTVKITETDGRLVFQTRALGGQAIWNGKNYKGQTISSGVYLVFVSADDKREKLATKIIFIHK